MNEENMEKENQESPRLSEDQVRSRLETCDNSDIIDEIYDFGKELMKESKDYVQVVESKATLFIAYGSAIATILVSSSSVWLSLGNKWTPWIALCAGICAFICVVFSAKALFLKPFDCISQDEWLKKECLSGKIEMMKQYRVLTMWGTIDSYYDRYLEKARQLQRAQVWLGGSVIFLVYLLCHFALVGSFGGRFWIAFESIFGKDHSLGIPPWQSLLGLLGNLNFIGFLFLSFTFILIHYLSRRSSRSR
jgi:hypothetical protein